MIATTEKTETLVKELIVINNDRYEGYKNAADETKDGDLKALFNRYSSQSGQFGADLKRYTSLDHAPGNDETKLSGKLYRIWMDVKAAVTANNRKNILASCEFGEDVALKTYNDTLDNDDAQSIPPELHHIITQQRNEIREAHNHIKALRDNTH
jgi:uncharacterized protein (TIGR02284 family)